MAAEPPKPDGPQDSLWKDRELWKFLAAGTQLAVTVALCAGLGWFLDSRYDWSPWGALTGGILGVMAGMYHFLKDALK